MTTSQELKNTITSNHSETVSLSKLDKSHIIYDKEAPSIDKPSKHFKEIFHEEIEALNTNIFAYKNTESALKDIQLIKQYESYMHPENPQEIPKHLISDFMNNDTYELLTHYDFINKHVANHVDYIPEKNTYQVFCICTDKQAQEYRNELLEFQQVEDWGIVHARIIPIIPDYYYCISLNATTDNPLIKSFIATELSKYGKSIFLHPETFEPTDFEKYMLEH